MIQARYQQWNPLQEICLHTPCWSGFLRPYFLLRALESGLGNWPMFSSAHLDTSCSPITTCNFLVLFFSNKQYFHTCILDCICMCLCQLSPSFAVHSSFNLYHSLGIFSRWQIDDIFLIFPSKQDLTFHANCLLRRQFTWNVKSCFLRKIRKIFQNVVCWKLYPEC